MKLYCQECGAANETGSKVCRICNASLPREGAKPDYGKFNFDAPPSPAKETQPPMYLGWSLALMFCCCCPLAILALIFSIQSSVAFKKKDYEKADRKSEATRKTLVWGTVLGFVMWIVIFVSGILD